MASAEPTTTSARETRNRLYRHALSARLTGRHSLWQPVSVSNRKPHAQSERADATTVPVAAPARTIGTVDLKRQCPSRGEGEARREAYGPPVQKEWMCRPVRVPGERGLPLSSASQIPGDAAPGIRTPAVTTWSLAMQSSPARPAATRQTFHNETPITNRNRTIRRTSPYS